jgi:hypothetical protein
MSPLTLYLAKLIGALLIVSALWMMVRKDVVLALMERIVGDAAVIAYIGLLRVTLGLALVIGHDIWSSAVAVVVSLIGWLTLLRGLLLLFLPHEKLVSLYEAMGFQRNHAAYAGGALLLGGYLLIAGYLA